MSYNSTNVCSCPAVQEELDQMFYNCDKSMLRDATNLVDFLMDGVNRKDFLQDNITRNGKVLQVEARYSQRFCEEHVQDHAIAQCEGGETVGDFCQTYTIDPQEGSSRTLKLTKSDFQASCKPLPQWMAENIQKAINSIVQSINVKSLAAVALNLGEFPGTDDTTMTTQSQNTPEKAGDVGAYVHKAVDDVIFYATESSFCSVPYVFGSATMTRYMQSLFRGCCSSVLGLDLSQYAGLFPYFHERDVETIFGANHFFALEAGAVQLIFWNEFTEADGGKVGNMGDAFWADIIIDPFTNIPFDILVNWTCPGTWTINLKVAHSLAFPPADLFAICDRLEGTNGILDFVISNPAFS